MSRLVVFNQVSLDGYFADINGDIGWAHKEPGDAEWNTFVAENASGDGVLLFGRITYDMMASYWPTPQALKNDPIVARGINTMPKFVFSRTMGKPSWNNTTLVKGEILSEVRKLKKESQNDMAILGSGSIVSQLAPHGLIDEYQLVVNPVILGKGKTMFEGVRERVALKLTRTRTFANGNVLLCYEPKK